ncbi:MAG: hypothetical protein FJZ62_05145 [Chlamydiae bacterium]|nr:hypothetical protein [Chlamydiota bacterium]
MEVTHFNTHSKRHTTLDKSPKPFDFDEKEEPFGLVVPLPSPFSPHFVFDTPPVKLEEKIETFLSNAQEQTLKGFFSFQKEGIETTRFSLDFLFENRSTEISFEVRYFDTAKMEIQLEIQGDNNALESLIPSLPKLYEQILASIFPYQLQLILPRSISQHPEHSVKIKNLCKQQKSVYGVNEDEQAL